VCIEPKTQGLPAGVGIAIVGQGSASFGETKPGVNQMPKTLPSAVGEPRKICRGVHRRRRTARWERANRMYRYLGRSENQHGPNDISGLRSDTYHPYVRYLRAGTPWCPLPSTCARSEPRATPPSGEPPPTSQTADGWAGEGFRSALLSICVHDTDARSIRPSVGSRRRPSGRKAPWFSKRILTDARLP